LWRGAGSPLPRPANAVASTKLLPFCCERLLTYLLLSFFESRIARLLKGCEPACLTLACLEKTKCRTFRRDGAPIRVATSAAEVQDVGRPYNDSNSYLSPGSSSVAGRWKVARSLVGPNSKSNLPSACAREFELDLPGQTARDGQGPRCSSQRAEKDPIQWHASPTTPRASSSRLAC
jgi:hypothetical protein